MVSFVAQGRELLACAPTGSGKTLAFSLPLLAHLKQPANLGFRALIISPTRELSSQVREHQGLIFLSLKKNETGPPGSLSFFVILNAVESVVFRPTESCSACQRESGLEFTSLIKRLSLPRSTAHSQTRNMVCESNGFYLR